MKKRVCLIILDSVGIGELPDAADFGDSGSHTLGNIYKHMGNLALPNLYKLGLGNIENSQLPKVENPIASYCRLAEKTYAKDTTCGHWEITGLIMDKPFRTYPDGFPKEIMNEFEHRIGYGTLGNITASGTEIIQTYGDEHIRTKKPIIYTSADSVFQIAAHEEIIPLKELYEMCVIARELFMGSHCVGRVIARPFTGESGAYKRTENRRDYAIEPFEDTILDGLEKSELTTLGIGKIEDIFCNIGVTHKNHTTNNKSGINATIDALKDAEDSLIFTNLVDFDMLYGHRNDAEGYAKALEYFDSRLPEILNALQDNDILIISADHGCDPTTVSTDHSREYVPAIIYGKNIKPVNLGTRDSFADIGATIYEYLTGSKWHVAKSFLSEIYDMN